ncbi:MAG: hypothetical protein PWQ59_1074 [Thermoanaerobacterium sp.]|nr:hypothetical protein [Thermoanaerobacterium sp.]
MKSVTIKELFSAMFLFEIGNTGVILYTNTSRASTVGSLRSCAVTDHSAIIFINCILVQTR